MKRLTLLLFALSCCLSSLSAQHILDIGNQWIYEYNIYHFGIGIYEQSIESITVVKDTTINNVVYKKLVATKVEPCLVFDATEYLREDGGKIFRLSSNHDTEFLMIDFDETSSYSLSYETIWTGNGSVENGTAIIDSFGTELTPDGTILDIQYLRILNNQSFDDDTEYKVVRGVGFIQYGLLFPDVSTGLCDPFEGIRLRCHISGQDTIHFTEFDCYESSLSSSTYDAQADAIKVYPNPLRDMLVIEDSDADYRYALCDVYGRVMMSGNIKAGEVKTLDTGMLSSGVYYLILEGNAVRNVRVLVKE